MRYSKFIKPKINENNYGDLLFVSIRFRDMNLIK